MLVLDASQGQNALVQAEKFHEALGLTGITVTKLDGSAKGGILLASPIASACRFASSGSVKRPRICSLSSAEDFVDALLASGHQD